MLAAIGLVTGVPAQAGKVTRAQVVNEAQWYTDNEGACFRITAEGAVIYSSRVNCRVAQPSPATAAGAILGGVPGANVDGKQYYRDSRGYCHYVDQYGQPHYNYDVRC